MSSGLSLLTSATTLPGMSQPEQSTESLEDRLRARIRREGPISFYEWMKAALYDEREGYYCQVDRIRQGRAGDYRTAPETSSLFSATFAHYFARLFDELDSPSPFTIVEVGAGHGDVACEVLSTLHEHHPRVFSATHFVIDEIGSSQQIVSERLALFSQRVKFQRLSEIDPGSMNGVIFSNELIDAFPVHRVVMQDGKWRELYVGLRDNAFVWVDGDLTPEAARYCEQPQTYPEEGRIVEVNSDVDKFFHCAGGAMRSGFVVTVDYGAERDELLSSPERRSGTLRGFRRHQLVDDVLANPGGQDLTTTIDWTQLIESGSHCAFETLEHERLDRFLLEKGLLTILEEKAKTLSGTDALRLRTSAREMIMPHGLAASFQVLVQKKLPNG